MLDAVLRESLTRHALAHGTPRSAMSMQVCCARHLGSRLALALLAALAASCQAALDVGQYQLEEGSAGAEASAHAPSGTAGHTPGAEPSGAGGSGSGGAGSDTGGNAGSSPSVGIDSRLPDAGAADAAVPPGDCRENADCASDDECFEAVCGSDGRCGQAPHDEGFPCGDPVDAACSGPDSCDGSGACQPNHAARGTPVSAPDGDCRVTQCDGQGQTQTVADNDDVPLDPGTGCIQPACLAGSPIQVPRGRGTPCEAGRCDGSGACLECLGDADCALSLPFCSGGACVECTDASQCPDPGVPCNVAACDANRCGAAPAPLPTACDDGFFCTTNDSCSSRGVCVGQQRQCPSSAPECTEQLLRCVECTSNDQCEFSCDDQGTCRS
jgi:hypothetical protein